MSFRVAGNGLQLGEVADLEALTFNLAQCLLVIRMLNLALNPPFCQTAVMWRFSL